MDFMHTTSKVKKKDTGEYVQNVSLPLQIWNTNTRAAQSSFIFAQDTTFMTTTHRKANTQ